MTEVKGRLWPLGMPFVSRINAADGKPFEREGFAFESKPGDFQFKDAAGEATRDPAKVDVLEYVCPQTGEYCGMVRVGLTKSDKSPSWGWNGSFETPTLTPSVDCRGGCKWHGHLVDGVWKG